MSSNQTTIMHIPTDMVPLIHQLMELRLMTPMEVQPSLCEESSAQKSAVIGLARCYHLPASEIAAAEDAKSQAVKSPTKKKRKKSAYQCFCSATINTMRVNEPERLSQLEESKAELWKYLGAEWQKTKLDDVAFRFYTDQANHINYQASVGFGQGEQVGTEESKEGGEPVAEVEMEGEVVESDGETPEHHVEVEKVLAHWQQKPGVPRYLIKFVGTKKPEWVDGKDCACDELVKEYWKGKGKAPKVVEDETPEHHVEVEKVLAHWEQKPGVLRYLIKFVGTKDPEWVDAEHCACDELVKEYWERRPSFSTALTRERHATSGTMLRLSASG